MGRVSTTIADDRIHGDRHLTLEYFGLEPGKSYSLTHHMGKDLPVRTIFEALSYEEIFPKKTARKRQIEEPAEIDMDPNKGEPWMTSEIIQSEEGDGEMGLHDWPPPDGRGRPG
jgi:hypothetical protein